MYFNIIMFLNKLFRKKFRSKTKNKSLLIFDLNFFLKSLTPTMTIITINFYSISIIYFICIIHNMIIIIMNNSNF